MSFKPIFSGFTFVFDGLTLKEKNEAINKVKSCGGTVSYSLGPKVTHLVVSDIFSPTPYQSDVINRHSIATVRVSYITECVQQEELLPVDEFSARTDIPSVDTSTSVSPASSTDEVPPPLDEKLDVELMAASEEGHTTAALSSPVVKKKVISGRNRNQKKIIVIQQSPVEQTDNVRVNEADAVQPVLKFVRADLESCSVLLSASLPGGKAKKLLGRLKDAAELDDLALVDTSGYLIKQVCCGSYHTALINHAGQLMTWGSGGARLGHGGNAVLKPTVVPGVENCVMLACSSTQTAVLTAEGQLIALDDNNGRVQVDASHCGDVAEIYCGNGVTALRNTANAVYFVGKFMKKSYGLDCPIDGAFKSVSFGAEHCLLVTSEGTIMAFGSNGSGQLGLGDKTERVTPVVINGLTEVTAIIAGERHSAALTKTAGLYVWGASPHGFDDMLTPVKHNYQHAGTVTKLEMSKEHLIALHSTGISRWPLVSFGSNTFGDDHTEVFDESARNVSCGAQHVMVEVSSCAAIAHQLVQHGTPDMATNFVNILGNEAIRLVDENQFTLLHKAILNMDAAAVLTALLDARSDWDLNAKTDLEDTTAVLCVMFNDIQALEVLAERGAQLELALIRAGDDRNMAMIELLLEYNVDRTCFFANKNLNDMPEIIVEKVAQAGGLLGMDFAPVEDLVKFSLIPDRATPSSELLPEKYPCKIGVVRGTSDMELAHKFTTALQGYGARIIADTWSHPDYISGDTNTLVAILTKTSVKDKVFVSKLIETYKSGKHIVPVWVDEEELEVPIEAKKKLKTLFVKSGVRFNFSASEVDSNEHNHRVRNFSKQLAAFNTKALHAPRAAKVSITDFSFDEEGTTVQSRRKRPEFRVYVSTTLHDMVEERELLLTKVFPEIEKLCAERGVPFSFTDMNAGAQSEVLDYDSRLLSGFDLIDKSSCFIGLFGERYGWHAQHGGAEDFTKNLDLAAQRGHQWVSAFSNRSINELEVVHGVLKYVPSDKLGSFAESYEEDAQGEVPRDVLFYYREPSYVQKIPIKKKSQFVSESYSAKSLLSDMKYRIGLAGLPSKNYRQPSDFAAEILNDLRKVLDKQFPPTMKSVDMADVEAYKQQDLAAHLAASSVPLFKATRALLHSYINSRSRYSFTIKGAQGSGKSYLLASIAAEYQKYNPEALVVFVAVDMTNWQNDLAQKSVIHQIKSRCGDCPAQSFVEWLEHAGRTTPVLLVVDGIDNLSEFWLPEDVLLPNNVKLVASRTDGYNSFFTTQLKIDDSEFSLYLSHCFNATKRKDAKGAFEEEDIKQRVRELPLAKNLAVVRFFIEEVSRASLAADVEEVISKFKRLQTLEDVMKEIVLPNLRKEFNNIEQALQILLTSSSPQEIFQKGISFERACRLKYLLNLPM